MKNSKLAENYLAHSKGKILAIDFGTNHVGLAITDESREFVFGRGVIRDFGSLRNLFSKINELVIKDSVSEILVGLPLSGEFQLTAQSEKIKKIAGKLKDFLKKIDPNISVQFIDESFSSFEANRFLANIGVKMDKRKQTEDELAAVFILHKYLKQG